MPSNRSIINNVHPPESTDAHPQPYTHQHTYTHTSMHYTCSPNITGGSDNASPTADRRSDSYAALRSEEIRPTSEVTYIKQLSHAPSPLRKLDLVITNLVINN